MEKYLSTKEAVEHLERQGLKRSEKTLAKLRCVGGGPTFVKYGHHAKYTAPWLDEYAVSKLSAPKRSTSDIE